MNLFGVGPTEIFVVMIVILILFGPDKLPELAKKIGGASREIRDNLNAVSNQMNNVLETSMEADKSRMIAPAASTTPPAPSVSPVTSTAPAVTSVSQVTPTTPEVPTVTEVTPALPETTENRILPDNPLINPPSTPPDNASG